MPFIATAHESHAGSLVALPAGDRLQIQENWAARPLTARLQILRAARHLFAENATRFSDAISPKLSRTPADTLAAEVLPLLEACRFLERRAAAVLAPRRLGKRGLPFWLAGVDSIIERVPFGQVLIIAPANYPLFLGGAQALQALAAGNAVTWKPGRGGGPVAHVFASLLEEAGLPLDLLRVTGESVEDALAAMHTEPAKIFFTGSAEAGRQVAILAAETATPVVVELSGSDAVVVLPTADVNRVVDALTFGLRLNGSATCMAPRRLFLVGEGHELLLQKLQERLDMLAPVAITLHTAATLSACMEQAGAHGARVYGTCSPAACTPILVLNADPAMEIAQTDLFAPVLCVMPLADVEAVLSADRLCPFGLTAAIFGDPRQARALADRMIAGTVLINDLIVPTADPRVPFGGRRRSGHGTTRGAEGLLEMTAAKVISTRRGKSRKHYEATGSRHEPLFLSAIRMTHGRSWRERLSGLKAMATAAAKLNKPQAQSLQQRKDHDLQ